MRIYVGNISYQETEDELRELFEPYGEVSEVSIVTDRETGRSRGFAFVEMPNDQEATAAIEGLNEREHLGRTLRVNEAQPRDRDSNRGGGRGGRSGGRSGGRGGRGGGRDRDDRW